MKVSIAVGCILIVLLLIHVRQKEGYVDYNYPAKFKKVIRDFRLGINLSTLYPKDMIPKDLRCDPVLDCDQLIVDETGQSFTLPPMRTKCLGDREAICKPIKGVKPYPLSPSKKTI
tara:strand:+ start:45 stop:392 length:348 start_codon:yes stop_codon:yes gene_type:complete